MLFDLCAIHVVGSNEVYVKAGQGDFYTNEIYILYIYI